jgi:hypothetical protein
MFHLIYDHQKEQEISLVDGVSYGISIAKTWEI